MGMRAKRGFDVGFSLCALLALSPFLVGVALWVRLDSRGPALFRQQRVGQHGRLFEILKFRTMRVDAGPGSQITIGEDPRITRAGAFLRKYKLDELPQFINVLRGEMSVVGPRPEVPRYVALYPPAQREVVLSVRPGITDDMSVALADEAALLAEAADPERFYTEEILPLKLAHAQRYVATRTFMGDLRIVLCTAAMIIRIQRPGLVR